MFVVVHELFEIVKAAEPLFSVMFALDGEMLKAEEELVGSTVMGTLRFPVYE